MNMRLSTLLLVAAMLSSPGSLALADESVGTKVGTAIKDAIGIILPPAKALIDTFWPAKESAKKSEVSPAVKALQDTFKEKLGPVTQNTATLSLLVENLSTITDAQIRLAKIQGKISGGAPNWDELKKDVEELATAMKPVHALKATAVTAITNDNWLRNALVLLVETNLREQAELGKAVLAKDAGAAQQQAVMYASRLADLTRATSYVFFDLNAGIASVASLVKPPMGGQKAPKPNPFRSALDKQYAGLIKDN